MSEEIDSTTTTHSEGDQASLDIFGASESHSRLGNGAFNHVINSINPQKRKFSGDYENDESCDESKKQRANGNSDNNAIASASDSASSHIQAADNVCRNGNEATSDCPGEPCAKMLIKEEIKEEPLDDNEAQSTSSSELCAVKIEVKEEATVKQEDTTTEEATSSIRDSCQYGIKCYREEDTTSPTPSKKQWTSKDIEIMLKMVKERPVIWQVDYSDRTSRPNAFLEIEKVLGFPALEIKRKLHNMRCTFRNQYKTAQFQNKPVKWKFYEAMKFMYCSALNESADHWDDDVPTKSSEYHKVVVPWKKRIRESHSNHSKHSEPKTTDPAASSNSSVEEDQTACNQFSRDDSGMFGVYVADSIRNLPEDLKELAKRQITHLLFDITAHTDARQCNSSVENGDSFSVMDATTNVLYTVTDPVYGNYPQTVLNETREIQLGLHEF